MNSQFISWNPECGLKKPDLPDNTLVDVIFGDGCISTCGRIDYWADENQELNCWIKLPYTSNNLCIYGYRLSLN